MDLATLIGLISGIAIITAAVLDGAALDTFINLPGVMIVLGGTLAAVLIKFPLKTSLRAWKNGLAAAFFDRHESSPELIQLTKKLAAQARKHGLLALEDAQVNNPFYKKGLQLIVDGRDPDVVRAILSREMNHALEQLRLGERVFRAVGDSAPAFGMIGTLVGLVQMLVSLDNPDTLGAGMAVALLTTLYGALIANLIALPLADKLDMRAQADHQQKALILDGLLAIQDGQHPRVIEELLEPYLDEALRHSLHGHGNSKGKT